MTAALAIPRWSPKHICLAGIAGAYRQSGLEVGDSVQARTERFADLGYRDGNRFLDLDAMGFPMLERPEGDFGCVQEAVVLTDELASVDCLTVSQLTNGHETADALFESFGAAIENMEGAGVALVCRQLGLPFSELRAVSNLVGPREPKTWQVRAPLRRLGALIRTMG